MQRFSYYRAAEPELPGQLLGVYHNKRFYRFSLETFHLYEIPGAAPANYEEHCHDVYHLVLVTRGNSMRLHGNVIEMPPGALVWVSPGEYHSFASAKQPRGEYHEITFRLMHHGTPLKAAFPELLQLYFDKLPDMSARPLLLDKDAFETMSSAYESLAGALRHNPQEVKKHIYKLLDGLTQAVDSGPPAAPDPNERLHRAAGLLRQNPAKPLSLAAVATQSGMSREYFCREFKAYYGMAPMQFRRNYRLALTAQMLRYSDKSLKEIAAELGYSDIQHLGHTFKEYAGISPQRFRQNN